MDKPIAKSNNRVRELRLTYHLTQSELAEKTNLSYSSIVSYENGLRDPNARAMAALEKFFGVTGEYLLGLTDTNVSKARFFPEANKKSPLLEKYERLDQHGKELIAMILDKELERCALNQVEDKFVEFPHEIYLKFSDQAGCAGNGIYLGPESFTEYPVVGNELTRRAAFAVPVAGDSMEPKFHNGDIVLVNFEPVESGDIALITMDGYGYIKKIGDQELLPLNPKYDPIPMDESVRVNGKVIGVFDPSWYI